MEEWPLARLHPDAPSGLSSWWPRRLKQLTEIFGVQYISKHIAALQLTCGRAKTLMTL